MRLGTFWSTTATHEKTMLSASQARLLQSAVHTHHLHLHAVVHTHTHTHTHTLFRSVKCDDAKVQSPRWQRDREPCVAERAGSVSDGSLVLLCPAHTMDPG